jgi:hypothetical protein
MISVISHWICMLYMKKVLSLKSTMHTMNSETHMTKQGKSILDQNILNYLRIHGYSGIHSNRRITHIMQYISDLLRKYFALIQAFLKEGFRNGPYSLRRDFSITNFCFPPFKCLFSDHSPDCFRDPIKVRFTCWIPGFLP